MRGSISEARRSGIREAPGSGDGRGAGAPGFQSSRGAAEPRAWVQAAPAGRVRREGQVGGRSRSNGADLVDRRDLTAWGSSAGHADVPHHLVKLEATTIVAGQLPTRIQRPSTGAADGEPVATRARHQGEGVARLSVVAQFDWSSTSASQRTDSRAAAIASSAVPY